MLRPLAFAPLASVSFVMVIAAACSSSSSTPTVTDAGTSDSGLDATTGSGCQPAIDISPFSGGAYKGPLGKHLGVCSQNQFVALGRCFADPQANQADCTSALDPLSACGACLVTKNTAAKWGFSVEYPNGDRRPNTSGCFDLQGGGNACGSALQDNYDCGRAACATNCPIPLGPGSTEARAAYDACTQTARKGVCKAYADKVDASCASLDADGSAPADTSACQTNPQEETNAFLIRLAQYFCGP